MEPSTTSTNGSSSPRSALKNHSMKSLVLPTGPLSKSISGQCTATFGSPGNALSAISSMLGWVAAVRATESPSQLNPALIHRTWTTGSSVGADMARLLALWCPITLARCAGRSQSSRHLPMSAVRRYCAPMGTRVAGAGRPSAAITVTGVVQGVGFRPFVHRLAAELGLSGFVGNTAGEVFVEVQGDADAVDAFAERLVAQAPPLAGSPRSSTRPVPLGDRTRVSRSCPAATARARRRSRRTSRLCDDCLRELFDPADRRYRHPFITCTNCGPRFTIITGLPYDRPATTMAGVPDVRGLRRRVRRPGRPPVPRPADVLPRLRSALTFGRPDAASDVSATSRAPAATPRPAAAQDALPAVRSSRSRGSAATTSPAPRPPRPPSPPLRARKARGGKPFAVMVARPRRRAALAEVDDAEAAVLDPPARPIVLLRRRPGVASPRRRARTTRGSA